MPLSNAGMSSLVDINSHKPRASKRTASMMCRICNMGDLTFTGVARSRELFRSPSFFPDLKTTYQNRTLPPTSGGPAVPGSDRPSRAREVGHRSGGTAVIGPAGAFHEIRYRRVISLSHPIHPEIPRWPGDPPVRFETAATLARDGYFLRRISMGEHSATHASAPIAFDPGGPGVDAYPPEALVAPAVVIDARGPSAADADYALDLALLQAWESQHGPIPP